MLSPTNDAVDVEVLTSTLIVQEKNTGTGGGTSLEAENLHGPQPSSDLPRRASSLSRASEPLQVLTASPRVHGRQHPVPCLVRVRSLRSLRMYQQSTRASSEGSSLIPPGSHHFLTMAMLEYRSRKGSEYFFDEPLPSPFRAAGG